MLKKKVVFTIVVLAWFAFLGSICLIGKDAMAHSYSHMTEGFEFPLVTKVVSLSFLGLNPSPTGKILYYAYWLMLLVPPLIFLYKHWKQSDRTLMAGIVIYGWLSYLLIAGVFLMIAAIGLWLPFSLM